MVSDIFDGMHYYYAFSSWPPFIVGVSIFVLAVFILLRERFSQVSAAFAGLSMATASWLIGQGFMFSTQEPRIALQWARLEHVGIAFIPSALFYFTLILVKRDLRYRLLSRASFTISMIFAYLAMADALWIQGMRTYAWGPMPLYGQMGTAFIGFFLALFTSSIVLLTRAYGRFHATVQKIQLNSFLRSFGIAFLGSIDFLSAYGINVYPAGYLPVYTAVLLAAQVIWRYRFADITPAFAASEITDTMPNALVVFDHRGIVCVANPSASELLGREIKELIGTPAQQLVDVQELASPFETLRDKGILRSFETIIVTPHQGPRTISLSASIIRDNDQHPMAYVCVAEDITDRKNAERALWASENRFRKLLDSNIIGYMRVGFDGQIHEANEAFLKMIGYTQDELASGNLPGASITPPEYATVDHWMRENLRKNHLCPAVEKEYIRKDGTRIPVLVGAIRLRETDGECLCFVIDSTERRAAQDALQKAYADLEIRVQERTAELTNEIARRHEAERALTDMAVTDPLTGLYNRRGFLTLAEQQLKLAERERRTLRLYFADLDGLKPINDRHGHAEGDHAITQAGALLRSLFRVSDVVARIGGDEFAVLTIENSEEDNVRHLTALQEKTDEYNRLAGHPYRLALSIGSATVRVGEHLTVAQLLARADQALYQEKHKKSSPSNNPITPSEKSAD